MISKLRRGRLLLAALPLLWLPSEALATDDLSSAWQMEDFVRGVVEAPIGVHLSTDRVLEIFLPDEAIAASKIAELIRELSFEDIERDRVLLLGLRLEGGALSGVCLSA